MGTQDGRLNLRLPKELERRWQSVTSRLTHGAGSKLLRDLIRLVCSKVEAGERLRIKEVEIELTGEAGRAEATLRLRGGTEDGAAGDTRGSLGRDGSGEAPALCGTGRVDVG